MYAVATFLIVAAIALLFGRLATGALIATGLPPDVAGFQARSAFTGSGFTTQETESVVNHPVRRRIMSVTMLVGNLGIPTLVVTTLVGILGPGPGDTPQRLLVAFVGVVGLVVVLSSPPVTRWLQALGRRYTQRRLLPAIGHEPRELLDLGAGFAVAEVALVDSPGVAPRSLRGIDQALTGLTVLGVRRGAGAGRSYVGAPPADFDLHASDSLVVYGTRARLEGLVRATVDDPATDPDRRGDGR